MSDGPWCVVTGCRYESLEVKMEELIVLPLIEPMTLIILMGGCSRSSGLIQVMAK